MLSTIANLGSTLINIEKATNVTSNNIANASSPNYIAKSGSFSSTSAAYGISEHLTIGAIFTLQDTSNRAIQDVLTASRLDAEYEALETSSKKFAISILPLNESLFQKIRNAMSDLYSTTPARSDYLPAKIEAASQLELLVEEYKSVFTRANDVKQNSIEVIPKQITEANAIAEQYFSLSSSKEYDEQRRTFLIEFTKLAGSPVRIIEDSSQATSGKIRGEVLGNKLIDKALILLENDFAKKKQLINDSFGTGVITGTSIMNATVDLTQLGPLSSLPDITVKEHNTEIGFMQRTVDKASDVAELNHNIGLDVFQARHGVNLEEEIVNLKVLETHYAAVAKALEANDNMLKQLLDIVN